MRSRPPGTYRLAVSAAAGVAVALWLGREVAERETLRIDTAILDAIHAASNPAIDRLAAFATFLGGPLALGLIALAIVTLLVRAGRVRAAVVIGAGIALATVLDLVLKELFDRVRPELWLRPQTWGESFPSGHALSSAVVYGLAAWLLSQQRPRNAVGFAIAAIAIVAAVALSRLVLGVHWPSDVLAGAAIGFVWMSAIVATVWRVERGAVPRPWSAPRSARR